MLQASVLRGLNESECCVHAIAVGINGVDVEAVRDSLGQSRQVSHQAGADAAGRPFTPRASSIAGKLELVVLDGRGSRRTWD